MMDTLKITVEEAARDGEAVVQARIINWADGRPFRVWMDGATGEITAACDQPPRQPLPAPESPPERQSDPDVAETVRAAAMSVADALAAGMGPLVQQVHSARGIAVELEQELVETRRHLAAVLALPMVQQATWAQDERVVAAATAHLNRED